MNGRGRRVSMIECGIDEWTMVLVRDNQRKRVRKELMNRINGFLREEDMKIGVLKA